VLLGGSAISGVAAAEPRSSGPDVDVADASIKHLPVEAGWDSAPLSVCNDRDPKRQPLERVVQELDGRVLVAPVIDIVTLP
jgi:hypothetical protein